MWPEQRLTGDQLSDRSSALNVWSQRMARRARRATTGGGRCHASQSFRARPGRGHSLMPASAADIIQSTNCPHVLAKRAGQALGDVVLSIEYGIRASTHFATYHQILLRHRDRSDRHSRGHKHLSAICSEGAPRSRRRRCTIMSESALSSCQQRLGVACCYTTPRVAAGRFESLSRQ